MKDHSSHTSLQALKAGDTPYFEVVNPELRVSFEVQMALGRQSFRHFEATDQNLVYEQHDLEVYNHDRDVIPLPADYALFLQEPVELGFWAIGEDVDVCVS